MTDYYRRERKTGKECEDINEHLPDWIIILRDEYVRQTRERNN
jgi:hypothetical protein